MSNHPNRNTERVTISNLRGESERVTLPRPHYESAARGQSDYTGVWITGLYSGPRTGRKFVRTHSIWQRSHNDGRQVGTTYRELDEHEYLEMCERVGCEPEHVDAARDGAPNPGGRIMSDWPSAHGYADPAAVIVDGEVIRTGSREVCETHASSQTDGREYNYAWRDGDRWVHRRSYVDGETL